MAIGITRHASDRLDNRLSGLVSLAEVMAAAEGLTFEHGETWLKVKQFSRKIRLPGGVNGDVVYAIVKNNGYTVNLVTVELRNGYQKVKGDYYFDRTLED